jgi:hypothetical protein
MSDTVLVALITGGFGVISAIVSGVVSARKASEKTSKTIEIAQAVTDTKLEDLTREVREHNNFARRLPVVEEQIKVINHRINDLEKQKGA